MSGTVFYLALSCPRPRHNLGNLIRCAAAFACSEMVVVGYSTWGTHGAHGSDLHVSSRVYDFWPAAIDYLRAEKGCQIIGLLQGPNDAPEGCPEPVPVNSRPFSGTTAFILITHHEVEVASLCDALVYVSQHAQPYVRLGLPMVLSIALHHFTEWANYEERAYEGEKFAVNKVNKRDLLLASDRDSKAAARAARRQEALSDTAVEGEVDGVGSLGSMFDEA
ncbi:unnamed protein product [Chrysoparadoxa australica]